jgi:hypothetical protein
VSDAPDTEIEFGDEQGDEGEEPEEDADAAD